MMSKEANEREIIQQCSFDVHLNPNDQVKNANSDSVGWCGVQNSVFVTSFQEILVLSVHGPHFH